MNGQLAIPGYHNGFEFPVLDFKGGLNTKSSRQLLGRDTQYSLRTNQYTEGLNIVRNESGNVTGRLGFSKLNATPITPSMGSQRVSSIYEYRPRSQNNVVLMTIGNEFRKYDGGGVFSVLGQYPSSDTTVHWAQMNDEAVAVNGADHPFRFNGSTVTQMNEGPLGASVVAAYRNHIFMIRGLTLFYTAVGTVDDFVTPGDAGQLPIPSRKGTRGTGMFPFYDRLIVWTDSEVFQLLGTDEPSFRFEAISYEVGHEGRPDGVIAAGNDIYFADRQGVHGLAATMAQSEVGNIEEAYASGIIEPTWRGFSSSSIANMAAVDLKDESRAIFLRGVGGQYNEVAVVADYYHRQPDQNPTWDYWDNHNFQCVAEVNSLSNANDILFGGRDGHVYRRGGNVDDGASFRQLLRYTTDVNHPESEKLVRIVKPYVTDVDGASVIIEPFTITIEADQQLPGKSKTPDISVTSEPLLDSTFVLDSSSLYAPTLQFPQVPIPQRGYYLDIIFSFQGTAALDFRGFLLYGGYRRVLR